MKPTFEMLREHRELRVMYPATRRRFIVSLREWQGALWGIKVVPDSPGEKDAFNPFVQKHRLLARADIEAWLERLRLQSQRAISCLAANASGRRWQTPSGSDTPAPAGKYPPLL